MLILSNPDRFCPESVFFERNKVPGICIFCRNCPKSNLRTRLYFSSPPTACKWCFVSEFRRKVLTRFRNRAHSRGNTRVALGSPRSSLCRKLPRAALGGSYLSELAEECSRGSRWGLRTGPGERTSQAGRLSSPASPELTAKAARTATLGPKSDVSSPQLPGA